MKKLVFFFLFICNFVLGQSGLDSLRLVVPVGHTSYLNNILTFPRTDRHKSMIISSDGNVICVWDYESKKLLYSFDFFEYGTIQKSEVYETLLCISNDTLISRNIKDGTLNYSLNIKSLEFEKEWTNIKAEQLIMSPNEKIMLITYKNPKKNIWKIDMREVQSGKLIDSFSGNYLEKFDVKFTPNQDYLLLSQDDKIILFDYFKNNPIKNGVFDKTIKSFSFIKNTDFAYVETEKDICVYNYIHGTTLNCFSGINIFYNDSILTLHDDNKIIIINVLSNEKIFDKKYQIGIKNSIGDLVQPTICFSENGNFLSVKYGKDCLVINTFNNKVKSYLCDIDFAIRFISNDGAFLIFEEPLLKCLKLFDCFDKKTTDIICPDQFDGNGEVNFSPLLHYDNISKTVYIGSYRQVCEFNVRTKEITGEYKPRMKTNTSVIFDNKNENMLILGYSDLKHLPLNLSSFGRITEHNDFWFHGEDITFNSKGNLLAISSMHNLLLIFSYPEFKVLETVETERYCQNISFSKNDKFIIADDGLIFLKSFDTISSPQVADFSDIEDYSNKKSNSGNNIEKVNSNGKFSVLIDSKNTIVLYEVITGEVIYNYIQLENNNWFLQLPNSPYYMCSKDASKMLHYVTPSLKVIGFEQLDPIYNRPDIVLDSIGRYFGNNDRGMIEEYRKAWKKRIERLGLKDQMDKLGKGEISVPNAEIENAESIAYENSEGNVMLVVKANDPKYKLRRFNVWVNEVPLYGSNGLSIAGLNKNVWDTTLSIPLSLGDNKIQVSVMNELGLENFKYPLYVKYNSDKVVPKTHYIGLGVDKFDNGKNLSFCVKDVKDLGKYFSKLPNSSIKLLTEKEVNKENIVKLKEYLKTTSVHDRVIISCSSHGILDSARNFYLATHDTDFESPGKNGISFELLDGLLDEIPARKKLLLLDACNSGENDEGYAKMDNSSTDGRGANVKIGDQIVKESNFKKMKELFVNVRNNSGAYIISATGGIQKALEGEAVMLDGKPIENGSFTYAVLEYLKENESNTSKLTVNQLKKYVEQRVVEITNGKQTPTSRQETMEIDWDLH